MSFAVAAMIAGGVAVVGGGVKLGMGLSGRAKRKEEQKQAQIEMDALKKQYEELDTSNIYADVKNPYAENVAANLENVYEDLTVNQQQAQFEKQMAQQQQANIMQQMGGAAGGSGIAALAQTMAQQGQLQAQRASASIGMQESQIQQLRAGEASRLQRMEVSGAQLGQQGEAMAQQMRLKGAEQARGLEWQKTGTMLGMSQQRLGAANMAREAAKQQQMSAVGDIAGGVGQMVTGGMQLPTGGGGGGSDIASTVFSEQGSPMSPNPDYDPNAPTGGTWSGYKP
tara:strand:- start:14 stop:862 length:849 start_codon:yes stop_codon:yes gene_type:complete